MLKASLTEAWEPYCYRILKNGGVGANDPARAGVLYGVPLKAASIWNRLRSKAYQYEDDPEIDAIASHLAKCEMVWTDKIVEPFCFGYDLSVVSM